MKIQTSLLLLLVFVVIKASANSPQITAVTIENTEKFTDFKMIYRYTKRDNDRLIADLTNQIQRAINRILPVGLSMQINITNVDMAGVVSPTFEARKIRSNLDVSLLEFDYSLVNIDNKIIKSDHVILEDKFLNHKSLELNRFSHSYFKYELVMFSRWLKKLSKTL